SGEEIPDGWHTNLVKYINSLVPRGDGVTVRVNHTPGGVTISAVPQRGSAGDGIVGGAIDHPFKLTLSGDKFRVEGGYVFGYNDRKNLASQEFPAGSGSLYFYIAVTPSSIDQAISAKIVCSTQKEYCEQGTYYFPIAEVLAGDDGKRTITQHQFGNLITPFRRNYIPVIDASLQCILKVKEGEGDEMKFMLQDGPTGPDGNQHLCTKRNGDLYWHECEESESSSSSGSSSGSSGSGTGSGPSSTSSGSLGELIPDKWYVFLHYYRDVGSDEVLFQRCTYDKPEQMPEDLVINRWTEDFVDIPEMGPMLMGYYYIHLIAGPFDDVMDCESWWREHHKEYGVEEI
ncbi:MAG: hypothetical protein IKB22_05650, partial [Lentisphaeria bacterium]|nr:hypothetical protein [Lentisphaeria bacterium]